MVGSRPALRRTQATSRPTSRLMRRRLLTISLKRKISMNLMKKRT